MHYVVNIDWVMVKVMHLTEPNEIISLNVKSFSVSKTQQQIESKFKFIILFSSIF